jgi:hypothetical protein
MITLFAQAAASAKAMSTHLRQSPSTAARTSSGCGVR